MTEKNHWPKRLVQIKETKHISPGWKGPLGKVKNIETKSWNIIPLCIVYPSIRITAEYKIRILHLNFVKPMNNLFAVR